MPLKPPLVKFTESDLKEAMAINEAIISHFQEIQARWRHRVEEIEVQIGGLVERIRALETAKAEIHREVNKAPLALKGAFEQRDAIRRKMSRLVLGPKVEKLAKLKAQVEALTREVGQEAACAAR